MAFPPWSKSKKGFNVLLLLGFCVLSQSVMNISRRRLKSIQEKTCGLCFLDSIEREIFLSARRLPRQLVERFQHNLSEELTGPGLHPISSTKNPPQLRFYYIGIFTVANELPIRRMHRLLHTRHPCLENFHIQFVMGQPEMRSEQVLVEAEQAITNDILFLPMKENMNEGKTHNFFTYVNNLQVQGKLPWYDHIMKADSDSFLHCSNLYARIRDIPLKGSYFGRENSGVGRFMVGMAYSLSKDLISKITESSFASQNTKGPEDAITASWLQYFSQNLSYPITWIREPPSRFYGRPDSGRAWAHPYTNDTIVVHGMTSPRHLAHAAKHFYGIDLD